MHVIIAKHWCRMIRPAVAARRILIFCHPYTIYREKCILFSHSFGIVTKMIFFILIRLSFRYRWRKDERYGHIALFFSTYHLCKKKTVDLASQLVSSLAFYLSLVKPKSSLMITMIKLIHFLLISQLFFRIECDCCNWKSNT